MNLSDGNPGLYVHLPFCSSICPYCDFYVLTGDRRSWQDFVLLLLKEIRLCAGEPWPGFVDSPPSRPFDSIYLGGGTPSILGPEDLDSMMRTLAQALPIVSRPWIGIEANPEDVNLGKLQAWKDLGIRFLSLGVQSFEPRNLSFLGRLHDSNKSRQAAALALASGIETVSIDLMYGLPGQTPVQWQRELETALELEPDHLSCYQLTIETGTPFGFRRHRGLLAEASPETQADLFYLTHGFLAEQGFAAYEVSNFAAAEHHRSRHNVKYWQHVPYLGLGPSAHSFAPPVRWWNTRKIRPYRSRLDSDERPIEDHESLDSHQLCLERFMLGLRTPEGVSFDSLPDNLGPRIWAANRKLIEQLDADGLANIEGGSLRPSLQGLAVAEALARRFRFPRGPSAEPVRIC